MSVGVLFEQPLWLLLFPAACVAVWWFARHSRIRIEPSRSRVVQSLRMLLFLLLCLALAGLTAWHRVDRLTVIFAIDESRSIPPAARARISDYLDEAARALPPGDRVGVITFGNEAMVESSPQEEWRASEILSRPDPNATNIEGAVQLAAGLFPPGHEARLVLITDGIETRGSVDDAILGSDRRPDLVWFPLQPDASPEVLVEQVSAPERVLEGEPHRVRVVARTSEDTEAVLRVFRGSTPVAASRVKLEAGRPNVFSFEQTAPETGGVSLYRARIETPLDGSTDNNQASALVQVQGRARVLLVDPDPGSLAPLANALRSAGMDVQVSGPAGLPSDALGMAGWNAVLLSDTAATHFSDNQLEGIRTWVEAFGGGFLMTGGPDSFGPGGYWKTPVEDVLPVQMEIKDRSYYPSLGLVLCIDKSGSMAGMALESKIEVAKSAAVEVARNLLSMDRIGVVAFDFSAKWVVPLMPGGEAEKFIHQIGTLAAGGGTDAYPALQEAHKSLATADVRVKHIMLLTDGHVAQRDYNGLLKRIEKDNITVSTIAIGSDADAYTLERIARAGNGNFYQAKDIDRLPRIFLREAFRVARSWILEESFQPTIRADHAVLSGVPLDALPPLGGYVGTAEKGSAQHLLGTPRGDPLLSLWRTGLGRSVAFTSDPKSRWGMPWLGWDGYAPFWSRLVRWSLRDPSSPRVQVAAEADRGRLRLAADVLDSSGGFVNDAPVRAVLAGPNGRREEIVLHQRGPGRYEAEVSATVPGPYLAAILHEDSSGASEGATATAVVPYSDEFRSLGRTPDGLERLVASGHARVAETAAGLFEHTGKGGRTRWPLAPWLLAAAACVLVLEVAARKLPSPAAVLASRRMRLAGAPLPETFQTLRAARDRAGVHGKKKIHRAAERPADIATKPVATPESTTPSPEPREKKPAAQAPVPPPSRSGTTSRLLAAKRKRKDRE